MISTSQTLKAIAVAYGYSNSPVASASYVIGSAKVERHRAFSAALDVHSA